MSDDDLDFADASGKGMAGVLLANSILDALILRGLITHAEAMQMIHAARDTAAKLQPRDVAIMAVSALKGLESTWMKRAPKGKS